MAYGIYSQCENEENNHRIIEPLQIKFARCTTDLFAVIYPEVERIFTLKFEDRCIQNLSRTILRDSRKVREWHHFRIDSYSSSSNW